MQKKCNYLLYYKYRKITFLGNMDMNYIAEFLDNMSKANDIAKSEGYKNAAQWANDNLIDEEIVNHFWKFHKLRNKVAHGEACCKKIDSNAVRASALIVKIMKDNIKTGKQPSAKKEGNFLATVLIGGAIGVALAWLFS